MAEQPNDASRKSKAEGDRWSSDSERTSDRSDFQSTDERSGITNRSTDEESSSQKSVPPRGRSRSSGAGESDMDMDQDLDVESRRNER